MHSSGLTLVYLVSAGVAGTAALLTWRRRDAPGALPLALMILAAALWASLDAVELQAATVSAKRLVSQVQYLAVVTTAPLFLHAAASLSHRDRLLEARPVRWAVWAIPALTLVVAWTSAWHSWLWTEISIPDPATNLGVYSYGWWFWVFTAHAYLLLAVGTGLLLSAAGRVSRPFRPAMIAVVVAVLLPWLGNVAYVLKLGPWPGLNWLGISLVASGSLLAWGARRGGLFELIPRARDALVAGLSDGVIVLGLDGAIVFANPAARQLVGLGPDAGRLPPSLRIPPGRDAPEDGWRAEVPLDGTAPGAGEDRRWLEIRGTAVLDRWRDVKGQLLVIRDVTDRKELERAREELIAQLRTTLDEVRILEGMLPICANCRKVRSDAGYWQRIEEYLTERMPVVFSHALCPACTEELYPEVAGDVSWED